MKRKSLVGEKFGKLTVIEMIYGEMVGSRLRTQCRCICDCGNEITVVADKLHRSKKSCGCDVTQRRIDANRKDLTGLKFSRLTVKEMLWDFHPTRVYCECDCGNHVTVISTGLTSGKTGSCGCLQKDRASESAVKDWTGVQSDYGIEFLSQSHTNSKGQWLWDCKCGECGAVFTALPARVMNGHITSCGCRKRSAREILIKKILDDNNVQYIEQYRLPDCADKYTLPFDFALFDDAGSLDAIIEYDGKQHYFPVDIFGGDVAHQLTKHHDSIKNNYCKNNDIALLRLPYTLSDIEIKEQISDIINP